jgi:hypothetical protein
VTITVQKTSKPLKLMKLDRSGMLLLWIGGLLVGREATDFGGRRARSLPLCCIQSNDLVEP